MKAANRAFDYPTPSSAHAMCFQPLDSESTEFSKNLQRSSEIFRLVSYSRCPGMWYIWWLSWRRCYEHRFVTETFVTFYIILWISLDGILLAFAGVDYVVRDALIAQLIDARFKICLCKLDTLRIWLKEVSTF